MQIGWLFIETQKIQMIELVALAIMMDTFFGVLRAIKEKKFNSSVGIDGGIRKVGMIFAIAFLVVFDTMTHIDLIGFIPENWNLNFDRIGTTEFFSVLFASYEVVSILKNMYLSGLPVKKVWDFVEKLLSKYTDELPDREEEEEEK